MSGRWDGDDNDKDDRVDKIERIADMLSSGVEWWEDNKDMFTDDSGTRRVNLQADEPMREAHIDEDSIKIVSEMKEGAPNEIGVNFTANGIMINAGGDSFEAQIPDDIDESTLEAKYNNGVLIVEAERTGEQDVETVVHDTEEDLEEFFEGEDDEKEQDNEDEEDD